MKTIKLIFTLSLFSFLTSNAQITKGNWMVGGSASFKSYKSENINSGNIEKNNYVELSPDFGYFLINKFIVGAKANFGYIGYEGGANGKSYNIGPFARYYFLKPEKTVNVFAQANLTYGEYINSQNTKYPTRSYGFKAGSVIFFNSSVGLEMAIEYNKANENSTLNNSFYQFVIGFQIHLEK